MKKNIGLGLLLAGCLAAAGCATKTYGRVGTLTGFEKDGLSCREIELETARTQGFVDQVNKESEFSGRDVLAILGDFGIGNALERSAALESANNKLGQLRELKAGKKCAYIGGVSSVEEKKEEEAKVNIPSPQPTSNYVESNWDRVKGDGRARGYTKERVN
jgi:hypothetical protein